MPGIIGEVPEGCPTSNLENVAFKEGPQFLAKRGVPGAMAHNGLDVLNELGSVDVLHIEALNAEGAGYECSGHVFLDAASRKCPSENWRHDLITLFSSESGCH